MREGSGQIPCDVDYATVKDSVDQVSESTEKDPESKHGGTEGEYIRDGSRALFHDWIDYTLAKGSVANISSPRRGKHPRGFLPSLRVSVV